jgi:hypothetical protein
MAGIKRTAIFNIYIEVTGFFQRCGGPYLKIDDFTYRDILEAIIDNRIIISRNDDGSLASATTYWRVREADMAALAGGTKPLDVSSGDIVYIADHAGVCSYPKMIRFIKSMTDCGCWHHRFKAPGQFRIYRKKKEGI